MFGIVKVTNNRLYSIASRLARYSWLIFGNGMLQSQSVASSCSNRLFSVWLYVFRYICAAILKARPRSVSSGSIEYLPCGKDCQVGVYAHRKLREKIFLLSQEYVPE